MESKQSAGKRPLSENNDSSSHPPSTLVKKVRKIQKKGDIVRYHCNYCGKDISNVVRVKCAVCADFDLCVQCFSVGVEIGTHKNNHDYHIMDILNFPLFDEFWGADEELLLLEGIEMYGLGNWTDVADHVGTKDMTKCKDHYFNTYINVPTTPLPDLTRVLTTAESLQQRNSMGDSALYEEVEVVEEEVKEEKAAGSKPPKSTEAKKTVKKDPTYAKTSHGFTYHDLAGYMPNRGDFETEFEQEAETMLMEMVFNPEDSVQEKEQKLKIIDIYNSRLDDRLQRKNFIRERNLLDYKKMEKQKKGKEDREIFDRMRVFSRLMTKEEHEDLINGLIAERNLRRRIEELKKFRKMGLRTFAELDEAESQKPLKRVDSRKLGRENSISSAQSRASRMQNREEIPKKPLQTQVPKSRKPGLPLDLTGKPGFDLLTEKERELCSSIRLYPQQYLLIKETILREAAKNGGNIKRAHARGLIKIDVNKTSRVFDFFETCGWINNSNTTPSESNNLPPAIST
eukprot:TRINITY_DN7249_c0_g2_i1.p1 TRINITY_DN7249_c0_g2~~TRINITY_DN7249_c0_g2_i1.p1  ORF type:complete len:513 (-),score=185.79 TRINITY_DN7249_c0_g2_i1:143-1681(-)